MFSSVKIIANKRKSSFIVSRCLRLLQLTLGPFRFLRDSVFRLYLMAAVLAIHALGGAGRFGHRRAVGEFALGVDFLVEFGDQLFVLCWREPLLVQQVFPKTIDAIALAPEL